MNKVFQLILVSFLSATAIAQDDPGDIQSTPELVMEEVFRAATDQDYSNLSKFCHPDIGNDGDTQKYICDIGSATDEGKAEFISYFKTAFLSGDISYSMNQMEEEMAEVPFWFNHPSGESRSNETMKMIKVDGKWYLLSF